MSARFVRLGETARSALTLFVDGRAVSALTGDTLLVALLCAGNHVRSSEFGEERRAGFCLMGACQDCWVWTEDGHRLRACTTVAVEGMRIRTAPPEGSWAEPS
jgi:NADH dehydrogenase/NADH:ubiquinone oxidoreductase subunit G